MSANKIADKKRLKGRGATSNDSGRFERFSYLEWDDGWQGQGQLDKFKTEVRQETSKSIISRNQSPDIPFDVSINPYRGCEHGCIYCYARPTHAYWGYSPGVDFETKLTARVNAAEQLRLELANPRYKVSPIALGSNTDPYQPIERRFEITRSLIEVLYETSHPFTIVTKSASVVRDLDLLAPMAAKGLVRVALSITSLDGQMARKMEPRASQPRNRLKALSILDEAGVPTMAMVAPVIPALTDHEMEDILERVRDAGVSQVGYVLLRLPLEIKDLFEDWLHEAFPDRAERVLSLMRSMRDGKVYDATWGKRMRGEGPFAELLGQRFRLAVKRLGLNEPTSPLRRDLFKPPVLQGGQMDLFH